MKEFVITEAQAETAVLVGLITPEQNERKTNEYLDELEFLATTAGAVTVRRFTQRVGGPSQTSYVAKGKLDDLRAFIAAEEETSEAYDYNEDDNSDENYDDNNDEEPYTEAEE